MASIVFNKHNKRKNRINSEKLFEFKKLGAPESADNHLRPPFRVSVRAFLLDFAEIEEHTVNGMPVWGTLCFTEDKGVFPLYTIEETVRDSTNDPFCRHCELAGWGHHYVCKRKYHFIVPAKEHWDKPLNGDFEEVQLHNLYGLIHCNGYGHLISVGGLQNNSRFSADDSMEFWNCLCSFLKARSISARHGSTREAVELSLSHGIAYGKSWFGKWGYKFIEGKSQGTTELRYNSAIQSLSSLSIEQLVSDLKNKRNTNRIEEMIEIYRRFSGKPPVTVSNLLKFMLAFESRRPKDISTTRQPNSHTEESPTRLEKFLDVLMRDCRWSARRLKDVLDVIVDLLKHRKEDNSESQFGMSRQELREEARKSIGDTGLIDFVLKSIRCLAIGNQIICRAVNPTSRLTEFTTYEVSPGIGAQIGLNLSDDLMLLFKSVLAWYPETQIIMHGGFVKEWPIKEEFVHGSMELICKFLPSFDEMDTELTRQLSPGVAVVVEPHITVGKLKMVAQHALRDTYCIMDKFVVKQIGGLRKIKDTKVLKAVADPGSFLWVRGYQLDMDTEMRYEDGGELN